MKIFTRYWSAPQLTFPDINYIEECRQLSNCMRTSDDWCLLSANLVWQYSFFAFCTRNHSFIPHTSLLTSSSPLATLRCTKLAESSSIVITIVDGDDKDGKCQRRRQRTRAHRSIQSLPSRRENMSQLAISIRSMRLFKVQDLTARTDVMGLF